MIKSGIQSDWRIVDRDESIVRYCKNRHVLHLGCTDAPFHIEQAKAGRLLQAKLLAEASSVIGVDIDAEALAWLKEKFGSAEYHHANLEVEGCLDHLAGRDIDVIVLSDVIEHVNNVGQMLQNIYKVAAASSVFIVTAPNAYSIKAVMRVVLGYEYIHPDHVAFYSPYTLGNILKRHGWIPDDFFFYTGGGSGFMAKAAKAMLSLKPVFAEGVGVVCKRASG